MEFLLELLLELALEGSIEVIKSRKVPKYIRYPLIILLSLFFIAVIGLVFFAGILSFKKSALLGILLIVLGLWMLLMSIIKFRKLYFTKINKS